MKTSNNPSIFSLNDIDKCMNPNCTSSIAIICPTHTPPQKLCWECTHLSHSTWATPEIPYLNQAHSSLRILSHLLHLLSSYGQTHSLNTTYEAYFGDIDESGGKMNEVRDRIDWVLQEQEYTKLETICNEIIELKASIYKSKVMDTYNEHKLSTELRKSMNGFIPENESYMRYQNISVENQGISESAHQSVSKIKTEKHIEDCKQREVHKEEIEEVKRDSENIQTKLEEVKPLKNLIDAVDSDLFKLLNLEGIYNFKDFKLEIGVHDEKGKEIMAKIKHFRLPQIKRIALDIIAKGNATDIDEFLRYSPTSPLPLFSFNWGNIGMIDIDTFIDTFQIFLPKVTKEVYFRNCHFSKKSFELVFKSCKNVKRLGIWLSRCETGSTLDFTLPDSKYYIEFLSFGGTGKTGFSSWGENPQRLSEILSAIGKCSLADSLNTLDVHDCGFTVQEVKDMLTQYEIKDVDVVREGQGPLTD